MTEDDRKLIVGLDLGGTSLKAGLFDGGLHEVASCQPATPREGGPGAVIDGLVAATEAMLAEAGVQRSSLAAVGVGVPGPVRPRTRMVYTLTNLPGWRDVALGEILEERLGCGLVEVANDADAAAFGEFERLRETDPTVGDVVCLTLGTGVGCGLIIGGRPLAGAHGLGNEAGHIIVEPNGRPCKCGQHGCVEQYASATALINDVRQRLAAGEASVLVDNESLSGKAIFDAAAQGDALAASAIEFLADHLALALIAICRLVDPEAVVLGGGLSEAGELLLRPVREAMDRRWWRVSDIKPRLRAAELGNDAGKRGAAGLARRRLIKAARR
ncbi:MAG: ROK family protein [Planctomycetota bacterium]